MKTKRNDKEDVRSVCQRLVELVDTLNGAVKDANNLGLSVNLTPIYTSLIGPNPSDKVSEAKCILRIERREVLI